MYRVTRTKIRVGVAKERGVAILEGVALWRERERESLEGVALWRERKREGERVWRVWHSGESVLESVSKWGHVIECRGRKLG